MQCVPCTPECVLYVYRMRVRGVFPSSVGARLLGGALHEIPGDRGKEDTDKQDEHGQQWAAFVEDDVAIHLPHPEGHGDELRQGSVERKEHNEHGGIPLDHPDKDRPDARKRFFDNLSGKVVYAPSTRTPAPRIITGTGGIRPSTKICLAWTPTKGSIVMNVRKREPSKYTAAAVINAMAPRTWQ